MIDTQLATDTEQCKNHVALQNPEISMDLQELGSAHWRFMSVKEKALDLGPADQRWKPASF